MNDQLTLLSDIITSEFREAVDGNTKCIHVHTVNGEAFCNHIESTVGEISEKFTFLKFRLSQSDIKEPYLPFLNLINQFISDSNMDAVELLENANVYPLHRTVFESYFNNKSFNRKDEIIFDELTYEIGQIHESIARLIGEISKVIPLIIAVAQFQYASDSTILFVKALQNILSRSRVLFIFSYNRDYHFSDDDKNDNWLDFTSFAEENYSIFDFNYEESDSHSNWPTCSVPKSPQEVLRIGEMNLNFFCFNSAIRCGTRVYDIFRGNNSSNDRSFYLTALLTIGDSYYYLSENDNAISYYRMLLEEAQKQYNIPLLAEAYRKIALAHIYKYELDTASKFASQSLKFAKLLQNELLLAKVYMVFYLIADKRTFPVEKNLYFKLLDLLIKYNLENTCAFFLQNAYMYVKYYETMEEVHESCDKAIEITSRLQNKFSLAACYHKKAIIYSYTEDYDDAYLNLMKSRELQIEMDVPLQIIRINNGLGYHCMNTKEYSKAHLYFVEGITLFNKVRDYNEVSSTLYNLCFLQFMGRDYRECVKIIDKILQIMKIFKMDYIPYRCKGDIFVMKAFCYVKLGELFKAQQLVNRIKTNPSITLTNEYHSIYSMVEGHILASKKEYEGAVNYFAEAMVGADAKNKSRNIFLPVYYLEYGLMLFSIGRTTAASEVLKKGTMYCKDVNFDFYKEIMDNALRNGCDDNSSYAFPEVNLNLEAIVEIAKQGVTLNKLHKKIRDIEFLNKIQELSSLQQSKQAIEENYLNLININFPCDAAFLYSFENGKAKCIASKLITELKIENTLNYIEKLDSLNEPQLVNLALSRNADEAVDEFSSIVNIPVRTDSGKILGLFLATIKRDNFFNNDDLNILSISMKQIDTIFTKIDQDQALFHMSRTDILTGMNNRQALQDRLNEEMKKIKDSNGKAEVDLTIMFIDLDNFKYYNDTFGHNMGDTIIKAFGGMLSKEFSEPDFIARFGGDEFVAILPCADEVMAKNIAERMIKNIFGKNSFNDILEKALGYPVNIPENKVLTCSVGIAGYKFTVHQDDNLNILMHNADMALYKAKSAGKNAVEIY